jgi:hypothetical protein
LIPKLYYLCFDRLDTACGEIRCTSTLIVE